METNELPEDLNNDKIIRDFVEVTGKHTLMLFKMLGLKTHIEVMLVNDPTGEEFIFSFRTVDKVKSDALEIERLKEQLKAKDEIIEKIKIIVMDPRQ